MELIIHELSEKHSQKGINYNLKNFRYALKLLGNPEKKIKNVIHIAGTNGKGSTLTFLASALKNNGYRVGTYTSPHLVSYLERIAINFQLISEENFKKVYFELKNKLGKTLNLLTEFEILTIIAFCYFQKQKPDFVILETGLGGRLDATNVVKPILSIITKIGFDHQAILGNTLMKITQEKAGIMKYQTPIITIKQDKKIIEKLNQIATKKHSELMIVNPVSKIPAGFLLNATYQKENLALAKKSLEIIRKLGFKLNKTQSSVGLKSAKINCRYEKICFDNKTIIFDAGHNPLGIKSLLKSLKLEFPYEQITFIVGIIKTKSFFEMLKLISTSYNDIFYCDFEPGFSYSYQEINRLFPKIEPYYLHDPIPDINNIIVITGSIYFLGSFRNNDAFSI